MKTAVMNSQKVLHPIALAAVDTDRSRDSDPVL